MPVKNIKRKIRRSSRRIKNWARIAALTLAGTPEHKEPHLKNATRPVMLIYGLGATRRTMDILEERLTRDGYQTFSIDLGGFAGTFNTNSIEELGKLVHKKIESYYKKYKIRGRLSIIGHSKGGLIGHYYLKKLARKDRVKTLITLGTPHQGNPWAQIASYTPLRWVLKSIPQMSPTNVFIKDLLDLDFPKKIKVYSIYSKDDIVCPFPISVLPETKSVANIEIYGISHSEFLIKKTVYQAIRHGLKHNMPESWIEKSRENYNGIL